jgi:hypothetical protein
MNDRQQNIRELELVVLLHDITDHGLKEGDVGCVVLCYANATAYEVEFMTAVGKTVAVLTLTSDDVRPRRGEEILHVRSLAAI